MSQKKEPKKPVKKSKKASEKPEESFLYDIIYCDEKRLAPILPQLSEYGLLKDLSVTEGESRSTTSARGLSGSAGLVSGEAAKDSAIGTESALQSNFDPRWVNILKFTNIALRKADRENFRLGKLCLVKGGLHLGDNRSFKALLEVKIFNKMMLDEVKRDLKESTDSKDNLSAKDTVQLVEQLAETFEHSVHGNVETKNGRFWISLDRDCLIFPAEEIILKFGATIPGEWSVLGIYDSEPDTFSEEGFKGDGHGTLTEIVMPLAAHMRGLVGKPYGQHSLTPLIIMREI